MQTSNLIKLPIEGMTCASCVRRVEKALKSVPGVASAEVNLATETAAALTDGASPEALVTAVRNAGYEARLEPRPEPRTDRSWWPVAASAALTAPLLLPMLGGLFGADWVLPGWLQARACDSGAVHSRRAVLPGGLESAPGAHREHGSAGRARHERAHGLSVYL